MNFTLVDIWLHCPVSAAGRIQTDCCMGKQEEAFSGSWINMYLVTSEVPFFTSQHRIEEVQEDRGAGWVGVRKRGLWSSVALFKLKKWLEREGGRKQTEKRRNIRRKERKKKKRRKNSIETDNIRSHLPLSSCYFSCTGKILHSCTKEEKKFHSSRTNESLCPLCPAFFV